MIKVLSFNVVHISCYWIYTKQLIALEARERNPLQLTLIEIDILMTYLQKNELTNKRYLSIPIIWYT